MENFLWEMGLLNPFSGWISVIVALIASITLIWVSSAVLGTRAHLSYLKRARQRGAFREAYKYIYYVMVQEFAIFFVLFLMNLAMPGYIFWPVIAAMIFAACHFPNLFYMFSAAFMWLGFTYHMEAYHNMYAILVMHFFIGEAFYRLVPRIITTSPKPWGKYIKKQRQLTKMIKRII